MFRTMINLLAPTSTALHPQMLPSAQITGFYIHVPFCFHKCHYCDFYSITRQTPDRMAKFVDLMLREADQWNSQLVIPFVPHTIFMGGGTPSLLPLPEMNRLLQGLRERIDFSQVDEWTVEANPATVNLDYCQMLKSNGVDRISFGAQSFKPAELKTLERHHEPADVFRSIDIARQAGFKRLNLDLIFSIPGQTLSSWQQSLQTALDLQTTHLSCYALTFEPNTPIAVRRRLGQLHSVPDELEMQMLYDTRDRMTNANLGPYEISNFAAAGQACRHNLNYWTGGNYIGLGPSAASHVDGYRWKNRPHLGEWETAVEANALPAIELEILTPQQRLGELAMLMLRLQTGFDLTFASDRLQINTHHEFETTIKKLIDLNLVYQQGDTVRLTRTGIAVADAIAGEFVR